ncbi:unnamed protein product [Pieris macdunnoughi]|uniref:Uncharacterized protein n=1 Tax=Pieris macdunnoughi TaxID=345717 RepID=A0A821N9X8_9NEOP|nr:unnamed protein product [Pieris macdunnoughi]
MESKLHIPYQLLTALYKISKNPLNYTPGTVFFSEIPGRFTSFPGPVRVSQGFIFSREFRVTIHTTHSAPLHRENRKVPINE